MKRKLPDHIKGTIRAWRIRKRREINQAYKAMNRVLMGAAYTPTIEIEGKVVSFYNIFQQLRQIQEAWSQKNWGK